MKTLSEFISNKSSSQHHALLLISNYFSQNALSENDFRLMLENLCGIHLYQNSEKSAYEIAKEDPDIFIADRERKILRREDIKQIQTLCYYQPQQAKKRLFFIENCERLNIQAANSLLKMLEEPPISCLFLFTCSTPSKVLPTILSRFQKIQLQFEMPIAADLIAIEDKKWIENKINLFKLEKYDGQQSLITNSLPMPTEQNAIYLSDVIEKCDRFSKEYQVEDIQKIILQCIQGRLKNEPQFINCAKLLLSELNKWNDFENYHPSCSLWLIKLFLMF